MFKIAPAPVDRAQLADALKPFGESRMLPVAAYLDDAVLDLGARAPLLRVGRAGSRREDLHRPRMMRAYAAGASGVLVVRDNDGGLRGFENACRHRGHELLPCDGTAENRAIVCPYHAWAYRLDGSAARCARASRTPRDFDPRGLPAASRCEVREWHGWIFANRGAEPAFEEHVGGLERDLRALRRRRPGDRGDPRVRRRGQLEGHRRELPGVLPLPLDPPRAVPGQPARLRRQPAAAGRLGRRLRWTCATAWPRCPSTAPAAAA